MDRPAMMRRTAIAALSTATVLAAGCLPAPAPWSDPHTPFGAIDDIELTSPGQIRLTGWIDEADTDAPGDVAVMVDGTWVGEASSGLRRLDVAARYPSSLDVSFDVVLTTTSTTTSSTASTTSTTTSTTIAPAPVTVSTIVSGAARSFALMSNGTVKAWGLDSYGETGLGSGGNWATPQTLSMPCGVAVTQLASGNYHSLALLENGEVYAWG